MTFATVDSLGRATSASGLVDGYGRRISYLRVSVTDRCDLRCFYCMHERQTFLPRAELLSLEELDRICTAFIRLGTRRLRLTGGEPLVRRDFMLLVRNLSRHLSGGALEELTLTTNGTQLAKYADELASAGVRRINVSIDSLDPDTYRRITRGGDLGAVLAGLDAAQAAGLKVKLNVVALRHDNAADLPDMVEWAHARGMDLTLIETMPLGETGEDRTEQYYSVSEAAADLARRWTLTPAGRTTGGPARYLRVEETGGLLGLITPLSHGFCDSCNRVRVTCTGRLYLCLGQDDHADLRQTVREHADDAVLVRTIREALTRKPKSHDFTVEGLGLPAVRRPMSMTGG